MRKLTGYLLWLYVFSVPWDIVTDLPGMGTVSRAVGLALAGTAFLTMLLEGRFRKPDVVVWLATAFTAVAALSLFWTISYPVTFERVTTYTQLLATVWVVREFVRTREEQRSLFVAFCLGGFVPVTNLLSNYFNDVHLHALGDRFTATGFNADNLGLMLVVGIPMAWDLICSFRGVRWLLGATYCVLVPFSVLITGTRGAFLAGTVAIGIIPLTMGRQSLWSLCKMAVGLGVLGVTTAMVVPQTAWNRIATIQSEVLESGNMTGRTDIWKAGLSLFPDRPLFGLGAGAYGVAVEPILNRALPSHNVPLGLLVEQGIVGLAVFVALLAACAVTIARLPSHERKVWGVLTLCWLMGGMSLNWEYWKATWLLFGLIAAQSAPRVSSRVPYSDAFDRRLAETPSRRVVGE